MGGRSGFEHEVRRLSFALRRSLPHGSWNRRPLRSQRNGILRYCAARLPRNLRVTLERLCIVIIVVAFLFAEAWQPTVLRPKQNSRDDLIVATLAQAPYGSQTKLGSQLLDDLPRIDALPLGNIDAVLLPKRSIAPQGTVEVAILRKTDVRVVGWFADSQSRTPGAALFPIVDGRRIGDADLSYGSIRLDVGRFYQTPALNPTGFALRLPAGSLSSGRHRVEFGLVSADRRGFFLAPEALVLDASQ